MEEGEAKVAVVVCWPRVGASSVELVKLGR